MYGCGYPTYAYNNGNYNNWIWIIVIIFILFFICFDNHRCCCHHERPC